MIQVILDSLNNVLFLSATFARMETWAALPLDVYELVKKSKLKILQAHIFCANEIEECIVDPFQKAASQI